MSKAFEFTMNFDVERVDRNVPVKVYFVYDDVGIGGYEFWGACGNHVDWQIEIMDFDAPNDFEPTEVEEQAWLNAGWNYLESLPDFFPGIPDYEEPDFGDEEWN
jgi:hypothetical protein